MKVKNPNRYGILQPDDPRLLALLRRHPERIQDELPAAAFGAKTDDPLPATLLLWTEPVTTISLVVDEPETRPFMRIAKLVAAFERWARAAKITRYYTIVDEVDVYYRHLVEKWGFREESRADGRVLYERLIDAETRTDAGDDGVRPWRIADWDALFSLVMEFLRESFADGNDFVPTAENAVRILERGMRAAEAGDPSLVAVSGGKVIGFAAWVGAEGWLETRSRLCMGIGTYITPRERRRGWSRKLRETAFALAKGKYDKIEGIALQRTGYSASLAVGFKPVGVLVRKEL